MEGRHRPSGKSTCVSALAALLALSPFPVASSRAAAWAPATPPVAVAPGSPGRATPAASCPVFHWGRAEAALHYELAVYALDREAGDEPTEPTLLERIPGSALGWSPALDRCLEPGATYAWSVRAIGGDGPGGWAEPLFFSVGEPSSPAEVALELDAPQRRRESPKKGLDEADSGLRPEPSRAALPELPAPGPRRMHGSDIGLPGPAEYAGGGPSKLTVVGEARTVDQGGEPRLWGEGRTGALIYGPDDGTGALCSNGSIQFGLSSSMTEWSGSDAACPEGTWVCTKAEIDSAPGCDTARPDSTFDGIDCNGDVVDHPANEHVGWLADARIVSVGSWGEFLSESDDRGAILTCNVKPVWCCLE